MSIKFKAVIVLLVAASASGAYYRYVYIPSHPAPLEVGYVLPSSVEVDDTPSEVRVAIDSLKRGDRVEVLERTPHWIHVRLDDGRKGWVEQGSLLDSATYESARRLAVNLGQIPVQAEGHTTDVVNLHSAPARDAAVVDQLHRNDRVEIYGRRLVERSAEDQAQDLSRSKRDAWYLVRAGPQAGWVLGRLISLDVPEGISSYAQDVNMVAWFVLSTVDDNGHKVPQFLVADRIGAEDTDFNHVRVFTWSRKHHHYATAYVESNTPGYFPIRIQRLNGVPYFRLRRVSESREKYQEVYGMFDTLVRPIGKVAGWESDALPSRQVSRRRQRSMTAPGRRRHAAR